jgi:predicted glycosyltransferase
MANSVGVVAMGGYNTFCEILSFDKRAIIVPRTMPRLEQWIRASRAQELGLVRMVEDNHGYDPAVMAAALRALPKQRKPSEVIVPGLLEGLVNVNRLVAPWFERPVEEPASATIHRLG